MARPVIDIDAETVEKLAAIGCKTIEIADFFNCSVDTIERRFFDELTKGRASLKMSLRRWQIEAAKNGNVVMMIWLGKQLLGQQDKSILEIQKIPDEIFIEEAKRRLNGGTD